MQPQGQLAMHDQKQLNERQQEKGRFKLQQHGDFACVCLSAGKASSETSGTWQTRTYVHLALRGAQCLLCFFEAKAAESRVVVEQHAKHSNLSNTEQIRARCRCILTCTTVVNTKQIIPIQSIVPRERAMMDRATSPVTSTWTLGSTFESKKHLISADICKKSTWMSSHINRFAQYRYAHLVHDKLDTCLPVAQSLVSLDLDPESEITQHHVPSRLCAEIHSKVLELERVIHVEYLGECSHVLRFSLTTPTL